jgi:hypothetical protein
MATSLQFQAPHLDREALLTVGTEFEFSGAADSNS